MSSDLTRTALVLALVLGVVVAGPAVGLAVADHKSDENGSGSDSDSSSGSSTNATNASAGSSSTSSEEPSEVVEQVDSRLRVTSYEYHSDTDPRVVTVTLTNTGERTSDVTLTEAISRDAADSGRFGIKTVSVAPGETLRVELRVYTRSPIGVMITTEESVESGHGTFLPIEDGGSLFQGDATWSDVRAGSLGGVGVSLVIVLLGAWHVVARESTDIEAVDLEGGSDS